MGRNAAELGLWARKNYPDRSGLAPYFRHILDIIASFLIKLQWGTDRAIRGAIGGAWVQLAYKVGCVAQLADAGL